MSNLFFGENNPMFGKKLTNEQKLKQKNTLQKNHGVNNAYELSKRHAQSKPNKEILDFLQKELKEFGFKAEQYISGFYADVFSKKHSIIVEFNGGYWHCDPRDYDKKYFNKKKNMYANEIWEKDEKRLNFLKGLGYKVYIIWEKDFNENKKLVLERLRKEISDKKD